MVRITFARIRHAIISPTFTNIELTYHLVGDVIHEGRLLRGDVVRACVQERLIDGLLGREQRAQNLHDVAYCLDRPRLPGYEVQRPCRGRRVWRTPYDPFQGSDLRPNCYRHV